MNEAEPTLEAVDNWIGEMLKQYGMCNVPSDVIRAMFGEDQVNKPNPSLNAFALNMFSQKPPPPDLSYRQKLDALCAKHNMTYMLEGDMYSFIRIDEDDN